MGQYGSPVILIDAKSLRGFSKGRPPSAFQVGEVVETSESMREIGFLPRFSKDAVEAKVANKVGW